MTQSKPSVFSSNIFKYTHGKLEPQPDLLAVEEPLEIQLNFIDHDEIVQKSLTVTMRTPGHDFELSLGFLFAEGVITSIDDVIRIRYCESIEKPEEKGNVVKVTLRPHVKVDVQRLERNFYTNSSCGVCGKASIKTLQTKGCPVLPLQGLQVNASTLLELPNRLRTQQAIFEHTGGLHAAALFTPEGTLMAMREDVGRHNALDKLIGSQLKVLDNLQQAMVLASGRLSFELVQKTITAQVPLIAAVGAPSSLAVQLAQTYNLTLVGFLRNGHFNIYSTPERIL